MSDESFTFPTEPAASVPPRDGQPLPVSLGGSLLDFSIPQGKGLILGDDGKRYSFPGAEWKIQANPKPGMRINFIVQDQSASGIYAEPSAGFFGPGSDGFPTLYRSSDNSMIAGVCAGLAHKFNVAVTPVRIVTVLACLSVVASPFVLIGYLIGWALLPPVSTR
jgi:phage shock protein PspC (stress-responsive transcriptional regulator)